MAAVLASLDVIVIILYFLTIGGLSLFVSVRHRSRLQTPSDPSGESESFFLAGRSVGWFGVGCSLFMSNIGSEHFVALAGSGASSGIAVSSFEWVASFFVTLVLGRLFVPFFMSTRVKTIPEFLGLRFSPGAQLYIACVTVFMGVVVKICVTLYSGTIVLQVVLGWNTWLSLAALVLGTCVYSIIGGLEAVILTEVVQAVVLLSGGIPLVILSLRAVGGWEALSKTLVAEAPDREYMLHLFQPWRGPDWVEFPWIGLVLGLPAMELYYWCTDQVVVQRAIAAKNIIHAKGGCTLTGLFKLFIPFMMVFPGMCARILYEEVKKKPNLAFPMLVANLLPRGLLGLMVAAMLAALMSSLASTYNSTSTVIVYDFYRRWRPHASDASLVIVGRISIVLLTLVGIGWIPVVNMISSGLYVYIQSIISYVAPPIAIVYLAGVIWRRATPKAALYTLNIGGALGLVRLTSEIIVNSMDEPPQGLFLSLAVYSNFLLFAFFSTCVSVVVLVTTSFLTKQTHPDQINRVFAHVEKGNALASYSVIDRSGISPVSHPDSLPDHSVDSADDEHSNNIDDGGFFEDGDEPENPNSPREVVSHLEFIEPEDAPRRKLGNEAQKVIINVAQTAQTSLCTAILWHFR